MSELSPETIKQQVRERYGAIARAGGGCGPSDTAASCCGAPDAVADIVFADYTELRGQVLPEADLGLGCGTPTVVAALQPGETVLDLGSGAGMDVFLAAQAVGPQGRVIGVDMTPDMIARARANAAKAGYTNVEFRLGEIEALPIADGTIDVVISNCVINLVPDKARVFAEIYRVLRPGGRFAIADMVTFGPVPAALRRDLALWAGCIAGAMDRTAYLDIIRRAGFTDVHVATETVYDTGAVTGLADADFGLSSVTVVGRRP
jgi:SAM-dependent methyltransferase